MAPSRGINDAQASAKPTKHKTASAPARADGAYDSETLDAHHRGRGVARTGCRIADQDARQFSAGAPFEIGCDRRQDAVAGDVEQAHRQMTD